MCQILHVNKYILRSVTFHTICNCNKHDLNPKRQMNGKNIRFFDVFKGNQSTCVCFCLNLIRVLFGVSSAWIRPSSPHKEDTHTHTHTHTHTSVYLRWSTEVVFISGLIAFPNHFTCWCRVPFQS